MLVPLAVISMCLGPILSIHTEDAFDVSGDDIQGEFDFI
jgi:hypothetical protein